MAVNAESRDYILELCEPFAQVMAKSMFEGCGLYLGGIFFAILTGDTIFLKADDETRDDFIKTNLPVFTYTAQGKPRSLSFYAAPEQASEEPGKKNHDRLPDNHTDGKQRRRVHGKAFGDYREAPHQRIAGKRLLESSG